MKISECSFCGMMAITDQDVCTSCAALMASETEPAAQNTASPEINTQAGINPFQQAPPADQTPAFQAPNNNYAAESFQNGGGYSNSYQPPPIMDERCIKCKTLILRGQMQCFDCANKKSSPFKKLTVFAMLVAVIGYFSFDYVYEMVSPSGTFRKYAKTTGADDSLVYENFVLKGDTVVSVDAPPGFYDQGTSSSKQAAQSFSFKMIYKKPNISSIEIIRDGDAAGSSTAFKQVFDGTRGWKYTNMPPQPAGYQDTDDAFAFTKMGLGLDKYDSLEFMNEAAAQEFGPGNVKALTEIKEIESADIKLTSGEKTVIVGKQKRNGKTESSLLVFDQKSGLLLGMIKNAMMGNLLVTTIIYFDKYSKFPVKRNGLFGVQETRILVPTKMTFLTRANNSSQVGGMPEITIELNVKTVETDAQLEDSYFQKQ